MNCFLYLCNVKSKIWPILMSVTAIVMLLWFYNRTPIVVGRWTKQTVLLWLLDGFHGQARNASSKIMLIDDDSGEGVFDIKSICDEMDVKASFAVIPKRMTAKVSDSILAWQQDGYGLILHGYNHDNWEHWSESEISNDIEQSKKTLSQMGFDTGQIKMIAPPYGCNTQAIRSAISNKGYKMVTGANLINPDTEVFQMGRIFLSSQSDEECLKDMLKGAKNKQLFVILGTHSSDTTEFSKNITKNIIRFAKDLGFEFITNL